MGQQRDTGNPGNEDSTDRALHADTDAVPTDLGSILVVIPTYNERDNIRPIVTRLHAALPEVEVLIVDDGSPDGTGDIAEDMATADTRVHVLHRASKAGLGAAYIAAFGWAQDRDFDVAVEMDADGSHAPEDLPRLLHALGEADLVIGSRYVPGGTVVNWPRYRAWISRGGSLYSKIALGLRINDVTAGFRAYRRHVLDKLALADVASQGYCFQVDLTWRTVQAGFRVVEVPITFTERERGRSKMSGAIVREALLRVTHWGLRHRAGQVRRLLRGQRR